MVGPRRGRSRVLINTNTDPKILGEWMDAAEKAEPPVEEVRRLFQGADAIEVSNEDAQTILAWAEKLPGWNTASADAKPLIVEKGTMDLIPADE